MSAARILGASYVAAVLAGDTVMMASYVEANGAQAVLDALTSQILVLGRRVAVDEDRALTQVGDAMVAAARALDALA